MRKIFLATETIALKWKILRHDGMIKMLVPYGFGSVMAHENILYRHLSVL